MNPNIRFPVFNLHFKKELNGTLNKQINRLFEEISKYKTSEQDMHRLIRKLEQENDKLESQSRLDFFLNQ
jgi:cell division protein FtsB